MIRAYAYGLLLFLLLFAGQASVAFAAPTYEVYQYDKLLKAFDDKMTAISYAKKWDHSSVRSGTAWEWNNYPYQIYQNQKLLKEIPTYYQSIEYAKKWDHSSVRKMPGMQWVWDNYAYQVHSQDEILKTFDNLLEAVAYSKATPGTVVKYEGGNHELYVNQPQYQVFQNDNLLQEFIRLPEAITFAKKWDFSRVVRKKDERVIWKFRDDRKGFALLDAPLVLQNPELPRGCEVTSVTMLLNDGRIPVNKMELAERVIKDPAAPIRKNGRISSWGDPHRGFVGNMYDISKPGFGVYHEPLNVLINQHTEGDALDLTGSNFHDVLDFLETNQQPVVTIINSRFRPVHDWLSWHGPNGIVRITYREHAVLLVGYDNKYVYVNDPLSGIKNRKLFRSSFEQGWVQMGKQAITYLP